MYAKIVSVWGILGLSIYLLLVNVEIETSQYFIKESSGEIWIPELSNAGGHVYPYMATSITVSCLFIVVMLIICFGADYTE